MPEQSRGDETLARTSRDWDNPSYFVVVFRDGDGLAGSLDCGNDFGSPILQFFDPNRFAFVTTHSHAVAI